MSHACTKLDEVVAEILQIVADDKTESCRADDGAEYFFRGEQRNHKHRGSSILDQLRMFGMTEEAVYPELSDVSKTLGKRFRYLYSELTTFSSITIL